MKKKRILSAITAAVLGLTLTACGSENADGSGSSDAGNSGGNDSGAATPVASGDVITLNVWGPEEDQALLTEMVAKFQEKYSDQNFDIKIGVESEATAKDTIITDVSAAADVFAFASDQLNALIAANALANLNDMNDAFAAITGNTIDDIKAQNIEGAVAAATKNDILYALPLGAGNNFFMYYDKSVISDTDVQTWDSLLEAANSSGKQVGMVLNSGWWNGGFFLGAGFTASLNDDGTTNLDWNGTSADGYTGVQVTQAIINIANNSSFMAIKDGDTANQIAAGSLCAVVSGSWDMNACESAWGKENVGVAKLPTYTIDGKQVQQGCYSGFKLMGVNAMSKQAGWAAVLAEFLTNEEAQVMRFEARQLAPTNIKASSADAVVSDKMVAASLAQDAACGVLQDVGDNYWSPTETFGEIIAQGQLAADDTAAIQEALDNMVAGVTAPIA